MDPTLVLRAMILHEIVLFLGPIKYTTFLKVTYLKLHCKVIIGRNPVMANANTGEIQLPGKAVAYTGN